MGACTPQSDATTQAYTIDLPKDARFQRAFFGVVALMTRDSFWAQCSASDVDIDTARAMASEVIYSATPKTR